MLAPYHVYSAFAIFVALHVIAQYNYYHWMYNRIKQRKNASLKFGLYFHVIASRSHVGV